MRLRGRPLNGRQPQRRVQADMLRLVRLGCRPTLRPQ
jgi:hypothetical protein